MGGYLRETGGIITVRSELGEPIHKVNNRALRLWKEYDDTVFKLPREKRGAWLQEHRAEVIQRLNADYFKPRFPAKKDGRVVEDLGDVTYEETVLRLVRLMSPLKTASSIYLCATSRETGCAVSKSVSPA